MFVSVFYTFALSEVGRQAFKCLYCYIVFLKYYQGIIKGTECFPLGLWMR